MKLASPPFPRNLSPRLEVADISERQMLERWGPPRHRDTEGFEPTFWAFEIKPRTIAMLEHIEAAKTLMVHANTADIELLRTTLSLEAFRTGELAPLHYRESDEEVVRKLAHDEYPPEVEWRGERMLPLLERDLELLPEVLEAYVNIMFRTGKFDRLEGLSRQAVAKVITDSRRWQTIPAPTFPEFEAFVRRALTRDHCAEPARQWLEREACLARHRADPTLPISSRKMSLPPRLTVHLTRSSPDEFVKALNEGTLWRGSFRDTKGVREAFRRGEQLRDALERFLEKTPNASDDVFTAYLILVFNSDIAEGLRFIEQLGVDAARRALELGPRAWRAAGFRREPVPTEFDAFVKRAVST